MIPLPYDAHLIAYNWRRDATIKMTDAMREHNEACIAWRRLPLSNPHAGWRAS